MSSKTPPKVHSLVVRGLKRYSNLCGYGAIAVPKPGVEPSKVTCGFCLKKLEALEKRAKLGLDNNDDESFI